MHLNAHVIILSVCSHGMRYADSQVLALRARQRWTQDGMGEPPMAKEARPGARTSGARRARALT